MGKSVAIMQPLFLPWVGFFDLIDQVDEFVFLDTVQFQKQSWQQRNRIVCKSGLTWLTVPVQKKGKFGQKIFEVEIKTVDFPEKQLKTIAQNYSKAPYFNMYWEELEKIFVAGKKEGLLGQLNVNLILWLANHLGVSKNFKFASTMHLEDGRAGRLLDAITQLGCSKYLSPRGSALYLKEDLSLFQEAGIRIMFQNYDPVAYRQLQKQFTPFASALDLLFNKGPESMAVIRAGRSRNIETDEV